MTLSMPSSAAIRSAVARLSPVSMTTSTPSSCRASTAARAVGRGAVSDRDQPGHSSVDGDHDRGAPTGGQLVPPSAESAEVGSVPLHQRVLPTVTRRPSTLPTAP